MKTLFDLLSQRTRSIILVALIFSVVTAAQATTYVIKFGETLGETYSPNFLSVSVGDTVQWQGNFSFHPLSSTSIPQGAQSFHQTSGSTFSYLVTVPGAYLYQCDAHYIYGMVGSFIATTSTGVVDIATSDRPNVFRLDQNYPNPFNPTTTISFEIPVQSFVSIKVYNLVGQEVATLVNENTAAGRYSKIWNAESMPSGIYFYKLQSGSYSETKRLVLLK